MCVNEWMNEWKYEWVRRRVVNVALCFYRCRPEWCSERKNISAKYTRTPLHTDDIATKRTEQNRTQQNQSRIIWKTTRIFVLCEHHTHTHALCQFDEVSFICYSWNNNKDINGKTIRLPMVNFFFLPPSILSALTHTRHSNREWWVPIISVFRCVFFFPSHSFFISLSFFHSFSFLSFPIVWLFFHFSICHTHMIYFMPIHIHIANCLALKYQELYNTYMYYITTTIRLGLCQLLCPSTNFWWWWWRRICFEFSVSNSVPFDLICWHFSHHSSNDQRHRRQQHLCVAWRCFALLRFVPQFYHAPQSEYNGRVE